MKTRHMIEIETESYNEQQYILTKFPYAVWITLDENKTRFYISHRDSVQIQRAIMEWENK